jgi:opacity protein-like surface antigen
VAVNPDWRLLAKIDAAISQSDESIVLDGDYVEASLGYAWRPVSNDRLNGLFRYTYLQDLPGPSQVNAFNQKAGPRQRSHVVSADFIRQLNEKLAVGVKYGMRLGEVEWTRGRGDFQQSTAHLAVARIDYSLVHKWDVLLEARALWMSELQQAQFGALAGVYRQMGNNLKVGVGYNFGRFSDDLTDLTHDDGGVFLNVIGQF